VLSTRPITGIVICCARAAIGHAAAPHEHDELATVDGAFSSRDMVGCEHKGSPLSGAWPTAILKIGSYRSESQSSASS
jgi:hypothetical protein